MGRTSMRGQMEEQRGRFNCLMESSPTEGARQHLGRFCLLVFGGFCVSTISEVAGCPVFTVFSCN